VNATTQTETVWFTTKGQVVIPLRLRKDPHVKDPLDTGHSLAALVVARGLSLLSELSGVTHELGRAIQVAGKDESAARRELNPLHACRAGGSVSRV